MKMNKKILIGLATGLMVMTACCGCSIKKEPEATQTPIPTATATATPSPTPKLTKGKTTDLVRNGEKIGTVKVNQVERVGFSDFTNTNAVDKEINYSYSVNVTVDLTGFKGKINAFSFEPIIKKGSRKISSIASVGWTGFESMIDVFKGKKYVLEVGVQPEARDRKGCRYFLQFHDDDGSEYQPIELNRSLFKKAKKGPGLRKNKKKRLKIKSVSGAVYSIVPEKVYFENHFIDDKDHDAGSKNFFEIKYSVEGWKAPTKVSAVKNVHGVGKGSTIDCSAVLGLESMNSSKILYQATKNAAWLLYADTDKTGTYVNEGGSLKFGYARSVMTNRMAESSDSVAPGLVRIRIEYPDEFNVLSFKKKLAFPGRFCVCELPISERKKKDFF